jgi:dUTP pyrophosphatase
MIKVKKLSKFATFEKARYEDIGYDLTAVGYKIESKGAQVSIQLGIAVQPPNSYYFDLCLRSSITNTPFYIPHGHGIIDPTYRGEWILKLRRSDGDKITSEDVKTYLHDKKIAQAVLRSVNSSEVEYVDKLTDTSRAAGGFGSTDKKEIVVPTGVLLKPHDHVNVNKRRG